MGILQCVSEGTFYNSQFVYLIIGQKGGLLFPLLRGTVSVDEYKAAYWLLLYICPLVKDLVRNRSLSGSLAQVNQGTCVVLFVMPDKHHG